VLEFRTTFDQAGRVAGLAGELEVSEAEVVRRLLNWAFADHPDALARLRAELANQAEGERRAVRIAEATGEIPSGGSPADPGRVQ
jgi:hypothetical protein